MKDWLHAAVAREPAPPAEGPDLYKTFRDKKDGCIKVMVRPD
jgi:threonine dehydrogenase-like Zn-dependent dehydrogenase